MQKVYLLLRNNQQTGPYSFEDLLTLHLQPKDLVWVEGKSHGWRYPNEIEVLKPYMAESELPEQIEPPENVIEEHPRPTAQSHPATPIPHKIFVSMPKTGEVKSVSREHVDSIELRAEELRKRAQVYAPAQEPVHRNFNRGLHDAEEEYTQWVYQTKTKKKKDLNKKCAGIVAISILILSAGWWASTKVFKNNSSVSAPEIVQQSLEQEQPSLSDDTASKTLEAASPVEENLPSHAIVSKTGITKKQGQEKKTTVPEKEIITEEKKVLPVATGNPIESPQKNNDYTISAEEEKEVATAKPVEKKKTIKEKISELFKNKKTEQPAGSAEHNPSDSRPGERTASHRNEEKEAPIVTDVSELVEIRTNKIADSWMMGVKNLKLTLVNKSNLMIGTAKVEVFYYSEQNTLLDKKILSFSNIPAGKSQTVAAPDQRLADHIEHKVISASGIENALVRH